MHQLTFKVNSNEEIWELFDKKLNAIFIHKFMPNEAIEWWETNLKTRSETELKGLSVRQMEMDIQTDLNGLKKILELNTRFLRVYQFEKPIPGSLTIERLPEKNREHILKQNGLKHFFFINFEFLTVESFDSEFIRAIKLKQKLTE